MSAVEAHFEWPRSRWDGQQDLGDGDLVEFFLEEPVTSDGLLYHAMVGGAEPLFFGAPGEVPAEWLDEESIRFYFGCSVEEFARPGFLEAKLGL